MSHIHDLFHRDKSRPAAHIHDAVGLFAAVKSSCARGEGVTKQLCHRTFFFCDAASGRVPYKGGSVLRSGFCKTRKTGREDDKEIAFERARGSKRVMSDMNASCHDMNASCHTRISHVTYKHAMSHAKREEVNVWEKER